MSSVRLIWSPTAIAHFSNWVQHIARDSPQVAKRERKGLLKSVERLKRFPNSGRIVPEFNTPNLREVVRKPIRIIYRIVGHEIHLLAFQHERRELDRRLFP